jgi:hypothetical protein
MAQLVIFSTDAHFSSWWCGGAQSHSSTVFTAALLATLSISSTLLKSCSTAYFNQLIH